MFGSLTVLTVFAARYIVGGFELLMVGKYQKTNWGIWDILRQENLDFQNLGSTILVHSGRNCVKLQMHLLEF